MADIELVIKIPEEAKQAFDCAESNDIKGSFYDHGGVIGNAIKNGTPLPKGHGRLGDLDALRDEVSSWGMNDYEPSDFTDAIDEADTIIKADEAERGK